MIHSLESIFISCLMVISSSGHIMSKRIFELGCRGCCFADLVIVTATASMRSVRNREGIVGIVTCV